MLCQVQTVKCFGGLPESGPGQLGATRCLLTISTAPVPISRLLPLYAACVSNRSLQERGHVAY